MRQRPGARTAAPSLSPAQRPGVRRLTATLGVLAVAVSAAVVILGRIDRFNVLSVLLLAAGMAGGEALRIDLAYRRGGKVRFGLSDTALTIGLLLLSGPEVIAGSALAMVLNHAVERQEPFKFAFNVVQYTTGYAGAALIVELLAPRPGPLSAQAFGAAAAGVALMMAVNTVAVGGIVALTGDRAWTDVVRRLLPTAALLVVGNLCLGLLAVLVLDSYPWALWAIGVPLALLYRASRGEVRAQLDKERSQAYVGVEQRLGEATSPEQVAVILSEGAEQILGCKAAVWRNGSWVTPVPPASGPCPVDPELATALIARGPGLGPAVAGACAAIGLGGGVLVLWEGDLGVDADTEEWIEQLARSGRVHFARAGAASALLKEQATLRAVVDGTGDGICVIDASGAVRVWNPAMATLAGIPAWDAYGRAAADVLGAGPWLAAGVHDVVRPDERVWRVSVSEVTDHTHGPLAVAVVHDVSAERRVARMKDDMLAVVSHELRTPLTPIKASAQLLALRWEQMSADRRCELLTQIEKRADHLARLVSDLLLVGQLSASQRHDPQVSLSPGDLSSLLSEAVQDLRMAHPEHEITLDVPDRVPASTDPLRLRQIVDNLVENACKFSAHGTRVDIRLTVEDDGAVLSIADQGRGIPPEDAQRIFERFERVEDPLLMTTSGAGLGLYIVRSLAKALGGEVRLTSILGVGTTFTVDLPLHHDVGTEPRSLRAVG